MDHTTTRADTVDPATVEALYANLCGEIDDEKDWAIRYTELTSEQSLYAALVLRIKRGRAEALAEGVDQEREAAAEQGTPIGVVEARNRVAAAVVLGSHQRVAQILESLPE